MTGHTRRAIVAAILAVLLVVSGVAPALASSHREAPSIANDPAGDNTDVYVFRNADRTDAVTIIACFLPFENPANGPLFYKFSDSIQYNIFVFNNKGDTIQYQFTFTTKIRDNTQFRYNKGNGVIDSITSENYNIRQVYSVVRIKNGQSTTLGTNIPTPPVNIGPKSTPNYNQLAAQAIARLNDNIMVFAGQRDDPYFADDGAFYDLLNTPISPAGNRGAGIDSYAGFNVQAIAIQVPITQLIQSQGGVIPNNPADPNAVIGVYASSAAQSGSIPSSFDGSKAQKEKKSAKAERGWFWAGFDFLANLVRPIFGSPSNTTTTTTTTTTAPGGGPSFSQISRMGHPLINALMIPLSTKDSWNTSNPKNDSQFNGNYQNPLPANYLTSFLGVRVPATPRTDLPLILLRGFTLNQAGVNFSNHGGGPSPADLLRLNVAVQPLQPGSSSFNRLGLFRGDLAGYPNGRRLQDDALDISMQIYVGATPFSTDLNVPPNNQLSDGVNANDVPFLPTFPYIATPHPGFVAP